jgi:branched-chain amino acid aminotransferase
MSQLLFQDGQFYRDDKMVVGASSRALRYGDGLFETMKVNRDTIQLGDYHMQRLFDALHLLEFELPSHINPSYFLDRILQLVHRNGHGKLARIRLMVFRGNGGLYDPENHYPHHIIQSWSLPEANHHWNENGLVVGIHDKARKSMDILANSKTNNYLPYIMGALEAKNQKWNDALILNNAGRISDSTIANIFLVSGNKITTPALEEGCVAGIMRRYLLEKLKANNRDVQEIAIQPADLENADEVFLTNSTYGIRWVKSIGNKNYTANLSLELYHLFIKPLFGITE